MTLRELEEKLSKLTVDEIKAKMSELTIKQAEAFYYRLKETSTNDISDVLTAVYGKSISGGTVEGLIRDAYKQIELDTKLIHSSQIKGVLAKYYEEIFMELIDNDPERIPFIFKPDETEDTVSSIGDKAAVKAEDAIEENFKAETELKANAGELKAEDQNRAVEAEVTAVSPQSTELPDEELARLRKELEEAKKREKEEIDRKKQDEELAHKRREEELALRQLEEARRRDEEEQPEPEPRLTWVWILASLFLLCFLSIIFIRPIRDLPQRIWNALAPSATQPLVSDVPTDTSTLQPTNSATVAASETSLPTSTVTSIPTNTLQPTSTDLAFTPTQNANATPVNVTLGKVVRVEATNEEYFDGDIRNVTDGDVEKKVGWANEQYDEEMTVQVTIDLSGTFLISRIRYIPGHVSRLAWVPDTMESPFGKVAPTVDAERWTEMTGSVVASELTIIFTKTRTEWDNGWLYIGEIEAYGIPQ